MHFGGCSAFSSGRRWSSWSSSDSGSCSDGSSASRDHRWPTVLTPTTPRERAARPGMFAAGRDDIELIPFRDLCAVVSEQKAFVSMRRTPSDVDLHRAIVDGDLPACGGPAGAGWRRLSCARRPQALDGAALRVADRCTGIRRRARRRARARRARRRQGRRSRGGLRPRRRGRGVVSRAAPSRGGRRAAAPRAGHRPRAELGVSRRARSAGRSSSTRSKSSRTRIISCAST